MIDAEGGSTTYEYNPSGRQTQVTNSFGQSTRFEHDDAARRTITYHSNGVKSTRQFDLLGRETKREDSGLNGRPITSYACTYDAVGNRSVVTELDGSTTHYAYDATGQLLSETRENGSTTWNLLYEYDAVGNRVKKVDNGETTIYKYGVCNELVRELPHNGLPIQYQHDECGRLVSVIKEAQVMKRFWDAAGRLLSTVRPDGVTQTNAYNADSIRIARCVDGTKSRFIIDGQNVLAETTESGTPVTSWTYANGWWGTLLSEHRDYKTLTYSFDLSSNTRFLIDGNGNVNQSFLYDAFGVERSPRAPAVATPHRFAGEFGYWHDGCECYYVRARYYAPEHGRWISRDPIGFQGGDWNLHRYVRNAAIVQVDPSGLHVGAICGLSPCKGCSPKCCNHQTCQRVPDEMFNACLEGVPAKCGSDAMDACAGYGGFGGAVSTSIALLIAKCNVNPVCYGAAGLGGAVIGCLIGYVTKFKSCENYEHCQCVFNHVSSCKCY